MRFRWNQWNVDHIAEHGMTPDEAEYVIHHPHRGYPKAMEDGKYNARGQTADGRYIQAMYIFSPPGVVYVIHARPLTEREKHNLPRRTR